MTRLSSDRHSTPFMFALNSGWKGGVVFRFNIKIIRVRSCGSSIFVAEWFKSFFRSLIESVYIFLQFNVKLTLFLSQFSDNQICSLFFMYNIICIIVCGTDTCTCIVLIVQCITLLCPDFLFSRPSWFVPQILREFKFSKFFSPTNGINFFLNAN